MFTQDVDGVGGWVKMYFYFLRRHNVCDGCQRLSFVVRPDVPHLLHFAFVCPRSIKYRDPSEFTREYINYKRELVCVCVCVFVCVCVVNR